MNKRTDIQEALIEFESASLKQASLALLNTLGYKSEKTLDLDSSPDAFLSEFDKRDRKLRQDKALFARWKSVELLFQVTDDEIRNVGAQGTLGFDSGFAPENYQSYLFFAIDLEKNHYTRTQLADITREINLLFSMPVILLMRHDGALTFAVIDRRLSKKDHARDVLEKVKLIKDIRCQDPHRAHIEILHDLALPSLMAKHECRNFKQLHEAWRKTLDANELNRKFYRELADWYFWALDHVEFPADVEKDASTRNATNVIRLLTRLIFCWFLKEKGVIPEALFNERHLAGVLKPMDDDESTFYHAILQNLFFGTLNQRMNTGGQENRKFAVDGPSIRENKDQYGIKNLYRYQKLFAVDEAAAVRLFEDIPFLNGGLFDCLDKEDDSGKVVYVDGFTRNPRKQPKVPNFLFFSDYRTLDLSDAFGDKKHRKEKVRGLINLLDSYKFTITENTPIEEEIALDPELLGKVFENLLASYNPETGSTARKQTGSFYTPREIVNYMVDESLIAYLAGRLAAPSPDDQSDRTDQTDRQNPRLRQLFSYTDEPHQFSEAEVLDLIEAIDKCKILDPACGSGAFPMGILHKLVFILAKLDPHNERWKRKQIEKAEQIPDVSARETAVAAIEKDFETNDLDYGRKLYLIENCIYGVDIQPIAIQISKLRFFISLICDQRTSRNKAQNCGVRPLPNLETKFVAANTLISLERTDASKRTHDGLSQGLLLGADIGKLEKQLADIRHKHFAAQRRHDKLALQKQDAKLREEIATVLAKGGMSGNASRQLAQWDPYDQNASAPFFDPEWMFDVQGFDIVIGNPPFVDSETMTIVNPEFRNELKARYVTAKGNWDLFVVFIERGIKLTNNLGNLALIVPNKLISAKYTTALRKFLCDCAPVEIRDYSHIKVFQEVAVYPVTVIVKRNAEDLPRETSIVVMDNVDKISSQVSVPINVFCKNIYWSKYFQTQEIVSLLLALSNNPRLESYCKSVTGAATVSEAYKIKKVLKDSLALEGKKFINTGTIDPYCCYWGVRPTRYIKDSYKYPKVSISDLGTISKKRLQQANATKIIVAGMTKRIEAFYDDGDFLAGKSTSIIVGDSNQLKCILAILNSKFASFFVNASYHSLKMAGGYININIEILRSFPMPSELQENKLVPLVNEVIEKKSESVTSEVDDIINKIDMFVYKLYGLNDNEIAIVEGETQQ